MKTRVLFFGEPVTLAHVARPLALARSLDREEFEVAIATGAGFRQFVEAEALPLRELYSVGSRFFLHAVARGRPVFPLPALERYVDDDLRHIREWRPDVVVGDFRISLAVSARAAGVPFIALTNAYWSPYAQPRFEVPVHPMSRIVGPRLADAVFRMLRPAIFAQHSLPMYRLRRRYGMRSLGFDLRRVFTEGDVTLFADVPELVPLAVPATGAESPQAQSHGSTDVGTTGKSRKPDRYRYIGPVHWSPNVPMPDALASYAGSRPLVYVTLGSSGDPTLLAAILDGLARCDCRVAVATAGVVAAASMPANVVAADFLPGDAVTRQSGLVVCNGGSLTCQQALAQGVPVLGIPANLDQLLNMHYMERAGAALAVRPENLRADVVGAAATKLLEVCGYRERAALLAQAMAGYDAGRALAGTIRDL